MYKNVAPAYGLMLFFVASLLWISAAGAARNFPQDAMRGTITEHQYPHYKIDSSTYRMSVGGRIYNQHNLIIMPASFHGKAEVMYRLDYTGELMAIWVLTREEAVMYPKAANPAPRQDSNGR